MCHEPSQNISIQKKMSKMRVQEEDLGGGQKEPVGGIVVGGPPQVIGRSRLRTWREGTHIRLLGTL